MNRGENAAANAGGKRPNQGIVGVGGGGPGADSSGTGGGGGVQGGGAATGANTGDRIPFAPTPSLLAPNDQLEYRDKGVRQLNRLFDSWVKGVKLSTQSWFTPNRRSDDRDPKVQQDVGKMKDASKVTERLECLALVGCHLTSIVSTVA